jgi:hypothetical protein
MQMPGACLIQPERGAKVRSKRENILLCVRALQAGISG